MFGNCICVRSRLEARETPNHVGPGTANFVFWQTRRFRYLQTLSSADKKKSVSDQYDFIENTMPTETYYEQLCAGPG